MLLARVLDKAIEEAEPKPALNLVLDTVSVVASMPVRAIAKQAADDKERVLVGKQYVEYRRTGKVRETMADDDRAVRALHAEEVRWKSPDVGARTAPGRASTGTKAERGRRAPLAAAPRGKPNPTCLSSKRQAPPAEKPAKAKVVKPKPVEPVEALGAAPQPEIMKAEKPKIARKPKAEPKAEPQTLVEEAPAPESAEASSNPRIRLTRDASVVDAPPSGPRPLAASTSSAYKTFGDC